MSGEKRPKTIFEQMLEGEQVNNEILVGIASDIDGIKHQIDMLMAALYPPTEEAEPTALGADTEE